MSNLNEIAMLGRELGFYLIIGMQRPSADSLPMAIRGQLNLRINMGVPTPEIEKMVFPDNDKSHTQDLNCPLSMAFIVIRSLFPPEHSA